MEEAKRKAAQLESLDSKEDNEARAFLDRFRKLLDLPAFLARPFGMEEAKHCSDSSCRDGK